MQNLAENWPLVAGLAGNTVRVHPVSGAPDKMIELRLRQPDTTDRLISADDGGLASFPEGGWLLISGPHVRNLSAAPMKSNT